MKTYQFYSLARFPKLKSGERVSTQLQMTFSGEDEDIRTTIEHEKRKYEGSLDLLRVSSQIIHRTEGFIKRTVDQQREEIRFNEYLEPVDIQAYWDRHKDIVIFQAPKKTCRGVFKNLRDDTDKVKLVEMEVDFIRVRELCDEYLGAWFHSVSAKIRAAGITGEQIQEDSLFKKLVNMGALSNVTVPWTFEGTEHHVMLTRNGAIVLVHNYNNIGLELRLITDVFDKIAFKGLVREEKPQRRSKRGGLTWRTVG